MPKTARPPGRCVSTLLLATAALLTPASAAQSPPSKPPASPNVLLIVADDLGVDALGLYSPTASHAPTPHLDQLAQQGITFQKAYSNPTCSTTRATIQTGRYSFRTGVGSIVQNNPNLPWYHALQLQETTLAEMLDAGTGSSYDHAAIGKWHLGNDTVGGALAPNWAGYDRFSGILYNVAYQAGHPMPYSHWDRVVNGAMSVSMNYAATEKVNQALSWINARTRPWFCYLAFNLPHEPFHRPPAHLHTYSLPKPRPDAGDDVLPYYQAMVQAMDTEIGRLLNQLDLSNTHVIFVGDNGTPQSATRPPFDPAKAKGTVYEGGTHVPLIIRSPAGIAQGRRVNALVNTTDLFATVAELAGVDTATLNLPRLDSKSLVPYLQNPARRGLRRFVYTERFSPNGAQMPPEWSRAVRDRRYKLVAQRDATGVITQEFYDLSSDPLEANPLPVPPANVGARRSYINLRKRMRRLGGLL